MKEDFDLTSYALFVLMLGDCQKLAQLRCFEGLAMLMVGKVGRV